MNKELFILIGCIIIGIYIITRFASYDYIMQNLPLFLEDIATRKVRKEFKKNHKKFYNNNDSYSATALKAIQAKINELNTSCQFYSKDFFFYYKNHRPVLKSNIDNLISSYISNHSTIKFEHNYNSMTPEQFFKLRETIQGDMVGVYILYNKNKKMYYVGQATRLFFRVNQHFTGHGNGDVYGDFKRGKDKFMIKLIPLVNSGYYDLDKLEKDLITKYNAYNNGYNKTAGNGNW